MRHPILIGVATVAVLGCAAGFYWVRARTAEGAKAAAAMRAVEEASPPTPEPSATTPPATGSARPSAPEPEPGMPMRGGEVLDYSANVAQLSNVARLRLKVLERKDFLGKSAWHLQAFAHTENPLRMVFVLDDQFDSYSDALTMHSLQYEMHLNERGQKIDSIQRMVSGGREQAIPNVTSARVLPGTRDPLGLLQYLRNVDWTKTAEARCPVYDGHALYDVRARLASPGEAVRVPAGNYKAAKVEIQVYENGAEMKDAHFTIYIANNVAHTPVLLEAVMPVATARVELTNVK